MLVGLVWCVLNAAIFATALAGILAGARRRQFAVTLSLAATLAFFAARIGSLGSDRFRLPMLGPMLMLAGMAAVPCVDCVAKRNPSRRLGERVASGP
jgi:hypothetical protein